jgi:hypothetical protein
MKFLIMSFFCFMLIIANINALSTENRSHHQSHKHKLKKQHYRPNVHDIKRFLKPMIAPEAQAYRPQEVDSLANYNKLSEGN